MSLLTQHLGVDTEIEFYMWQNWIYSTISIAATILAAILNFEQVQITQWLVSLSYMKQDTLFDISAKFQNCRIKRTTLLKFNTQPLH